MKYTNSLKNKNKSSCEDRSSKELIKEIEFRVKVLFIKKTPDPDNFAGRFYQTFQEETILTLPNVFQITDEERLLPSSTVKPALLEGQRYVTGKALAHGEPGFPGRCWGT